MQNDYIKLEGSEETQNKRLIWDWLHKMAEQAAAIEVKAESFLSVLLLSFFPATFFSI